jgi:mono/diheme cytochrome c family protein
MTDNPWLKDDKDRLIKVVLKGLCGPMKLKGQTFYPSKGVPPMPGFALLLSDEEVAAVIDYVRNSFGNESEFIQADQVSRIRQSIEGRQDFYRIEENMGEHPIQGWEAWSKRAGNYQSFE